MRAGEGVLRGRPLLCEKRLPRAPTRRAAGNRLELSFKRARPRCMGANLRRKSQAYSQLLFGRGGLGERGFSQRSRLSPRISRYLSVFRGGSAREETFLQKSLLPRIINILLILSRVVQQTTGEDHAALARSEGKENGVVVPLGLVAERQALFTGGNGGANIGQG